MATQDWSTLRYPRPHGHAVAPGDGFRGGSAALWPGAGPGSGLCLANAGPSSSGGGSLRHGVQAWRRLVRGRTASSPRLHPRAFSGHLSGSLWWVPQLTPQRHTSASSKAWSQQGAERGRCAVSPPAETRCGAPFTPAPRRAAARCARSAPRRGIAAGLRTVGAVARRRVKVADETGAGRAVLPPACRFPTLRIWKAIPGRRFAAPPASSSSPSEILLTRLTLSRAVRRSAAFVGLGRSERDAPIDARPRRSGVGAQQEKIASEQ
jgi:hypothetical protein